MRKYYCRTLLTLLLIITAAGLTACGAGGATGSNESNSSSSTPDPRNLSRTTDDSEGPLLAFDATLISVSWLEAVPASGGVSPHREIYATSLSLKDPANKSFSAPQSLSNNFDALQHGIVNTISGKPLGVFVGTRLPSGTPAREIFSNHDPGKLPKQISYIESPPLPARNPTTKKTPGGTLYMAWAEGEAGKEGIKFTSDDGGNGQPPIQKISPTAGVVFEGPFLAIGPTSAANIVWTTETGNDQRLFFSRTTDGGSTFDTQSLSPEGSDASCPQVGVSGNNRSYVTWVASESGSSGLYITYTAESGSFTSPTILKRNPASCPRMATGSASQIYLVWEEAGKIYFALSRNGEVFLDPITVSGDLSAPSSPMIAVKDQTILVVWTASSSNNAEVFLSASSNGGQTFSAPVNISNTSADSTAPVIAMNDSGQVYMAWTEGPPGGRDIYIQSYSKSHILSDTTPGAYLRSHDIDGDGYSDILIGAPGENNASGNAYIYFGPDGASLNSLTISQGGGAYGSSVAVIGDVNNDGFDDLLVGAPSLDTGIYTESGSAYLYLGGSNSRAEKPTLVGSIAGNSHYARMGERVSGAGDVNGDGCSDFLAGAPGAQGGGSSRGEAYLFFGGGKGCLDNDLDLVPDIIFTGSVQDGNYEDSNFGSALGTAGDVNGDGYDDFMIAAPDYLNKKGMAHLYLGGAEINKTPAITLEGINAGEQFGHGIATAGDINLDNYMDFIIGAPGQDAGYTEESRGKALIYLGGPSLSTTPHLSIKGENMGDNFGFSVAGIGDVDYDAYGDILIGSPRWDKDSTAIKAGRAYLFSGKGLAQSSAGTTLQASSANASWEGSEKYVYLGWAVSDGGDVNGDNIADFLISAPLWKDENKATLGAVDLFLGSSTSTLDTTIDVRLNGETSSGFFGSTLNKTLPQLP